MSQNEQPFGPSHPVESSSAATVPSGNAASGNTSDEQYKPLAIPTQHQQEVPITDTTPGVSDLQRPEPALLPPPTQLSTAEDEDDGDVPTSAAALTPGASVNITLLLTTGARHPFTIDQKYLKKRNVAPGTEEVDPFQISVYTMKELIWRDWREEWEPRPTSPAAIRLIHFGKLLDDKTTLKDCRFQASVPNVVHMTVKPQDVVEEEENTKGVKGSTRGRGSSEREGGFRCCAVM